MDAQPGNQSISAKINDRLFIQQLGYTRSLVIFLIRRQALPGKLTDVFGNLAALGALRYSRAGRAVTEEEWRKLYSISHDLTSELPLDVVTAFGIWQLRTYFVLCPIIFLIMAIIAVSVPYFAGWVAEGSGVYYLLGIVAVLLWTCTLGALGTSAFFGTSLLAQLASAPGNDQPKLKEITDSAYLQTRLMIGIMFAFVIGLPFGRLSLDTASVSLYKEVTWNNDIYMTILHILAPFLLGFSTALVLAILERLIEGIKTILGFAQPASAKVVRAP
jgi:hypothetical protein